MSLMQCWHNLNHFDNVLNISFSDGCKFEDIFKVCHQNSDLLTVLAFFQIILFATHNVLYADQNTQLLLHCICSKAILCMWVGLDVHTDKTIAAGHQELNKFSSLMAVSTCQI